MSPAKSKVPIITNNNSDNDSSYNSSFTEGDPDSFNDEYFRRQSTIL